MALWTDDTGPPAPERAAPRRRVPRWLSWVLGAVLVVSVAVAVCAVLLVRDAYAARDALDDAAAAIPSVEQAIRSQLTDPAPDAPPLTQTPEIADLQESTQRARESTDGLVWRLAKGLPAIGPSVAATATVAAVVDDVADVALPALAATADAATRTARTDDGGLDLAPLAAAADDVSQALDVVSAARTELGGVDTARLQSAFVEPVVELDGRLTDLELMLATAERATTLLPPMLGADGARRYVLLGLSNAELRAAGGIPGALMGLEVDGGRVDVDDQVASNAVGPFAEPVLPLDPEDEAAYGTILGRYVQDLTITPDFATTGPLAAEMWRRSQGVTVDGVIATDPVALSILLDATGPVTVTVPGDLADALGMPEVEVEASTVVDLLLRRTYDVLDAEQADEFYATVAAAVFSELTAGDVAPADLLPAVERIARQHRLVVWSAHPDEQALLAGTLLAGTFADERARDAVGVFLDDRVIGKLSAYLDAQVTLTGSQCTQTGRQDTLEVTLTNRLDRATARALPDYVAGPADTPGRGRMELNLSVQGARGDDVPRLSRDGEAVGAETVTVHGRQRVLTSVSLRPGRSTTFAVTVAATPEAARGEGVSRPGTLEVWSTPTVSMPGLHVLDVPMCG